MKQLKINKIIMISLLLLLVLIQACDGNPRGPNIPNYYQGSQGLEIKFLNNAPPTNVYEGSIIGVMAEIWNKGAYTIPPRESVISLRYDTLQFSRNYDSGNFFLLQNNMRELPLLSGKTEVWPRGESIILPLAQLNVLDITGTREMPKTNIELIACYSYKTFLTETICLDTDIYQVDENPICRNRERYTYSNQGAPIAVTKLEVDMLPVAIVDGKDVNVYTPVYDPVGVEDFVQTTETGKLVLIEPVIRIYAKNVARGTVFLSNNEAISTMNLCSGNQMYFNYRDNNKIKLTKATLDGLAMDCGEKITLNLANPSDFLTCRLNTEQTGYLRQNIQVQLSLEFSYHYRESITNELTVRRKP